MIDKSIPDYSDGKITCGWCGHKHHVQFKTLDGEIETNNNQAVMTMECPQCGNNDYTKTTYITEDGKVPLTISN